MGIRKKREELTCKTNDIELFLLWLQNYLDYYF